MNCKILRWTMLAGCFGMGAQAIADDRDRLSATTKGSLLIYSKIELKWQRQADGTYQLAQDTFLTLQNDYPEDVTVQLNFVNGDAPTAQVCSTQPGCLVAGPCPPQCVIERPHPGWNHFDCLVTLTGNQPLYYSAATGGPLDCPAFTVLDAGFPPGRPDPEARFGSSSRVLRGFLYAWAVKPDRAGGLDNYQIRWNHLSGDASLVNYFRGTAAKFSAYAAQVVDHRLWPSNGDFVGQGGILRLDGAEYQSAFDQLLLNFYASRSSALSSANVVVSLDTDLTFHAVDLDLRQDGGGPVSTRIKFDIWNENEIHFAAIHRCITCWDQTLASRYAAPNLFLRTELHTDKGAARLSGIASSPSGPCPLAQDAALLGVAIEHLTFAPRTTGGTTTAATAAFNLVGEGARSATIQYDLKDLSDSRVRPVDDAQIGIVNPAKDR